MKTIRRFFDYFTVAEKLLWLFSVTVICVSYLLFASGGALNLAASLIGVTSLIFIAKGNPFGQILTIVFSLIYGFISCKVMYYGEMLTYVGMTMPMAVAALVMWLKNPYKGKKSEVKINMSMTGADVVKMVLLAAFVTFVFYFILKALNTANMVPSTVSVTTSFLAVYLSYKRSPYYAAAYAANDIVLIVLWVTASFTDKSYISVVVCFAAFLANDIYGFINWQRMGKRQQQ